MASSTQKLAKMEMYAGESIPLRFDIFDLDLDPDGTTPIDLFDRTACWSLARLSGGNYAEDPELDLNSDGTQVSVDVQRVESALVSGGGTGYEAGDVLTVVGGEGIPATFRVLTVNGSGAVLTIEAANDGGSYSTIPTTPADATVGGNDTCTLSLTMETRRGTVLVTLAEADTEALLGDFHQELELVDTSGRRRVVAVGDVRILRNVENA